MHENDIGTIIVDCAVHLHRDLGPGLLETVDEVTLARKLEQRGLSVQRQIPVAIEYDGQKFDEGFRADLIVEGKVIIELKSVEKVHPAHKKQPRRASSRFGTRNRNATTSRRPNNSR